jgi:hypothetical protein
MNTFPGHRPADFFTCAALGALLALLPAQAPLQAYGRLRQENPLPPSQPQQGDTPKRKYEYRSKVSGIKVVDIRNLQADEWVEKLEVEVKNISDKPIYYILLWVVVDEAKGPPSYLPLGFNIKYGNLRHLNIGSLAEPEDEFIKPGESLILKIPNSQVRGWNSRKSEYKYPPITRVEFYFETINFGDGTGYFAGKPHSSTPRRVSSITPAQVRPG